MKGAAGKLAAKECELPHLVQVAAEKVAAKEFELPHRVKVAAKVAAMEGELPYLVLLPRRLLPRSVSCRPL